MRVSKALIEFEGKINGYFAQCEKDGIYPDEAGMILALGITKARYEKYRDGTDGRYAGYTRCIEEARLRRESIIVRGIYSTDKSPTGKIFLARQPGNGGLSDKPKDEDKKVTIEVVIIGEAEHFD